MASNVDAVIAALHSVLGEAERRTFQTWWKRHTVNRWISQLPGAWMGRWRHLKLGGALEGDVLREDLISHVRANLAYLEANRDVIQSHVWSWPFTRGKRQSTPEPIDAQFDEVSATQEEQLKKCPQQVRLLKR